MIIVPDPQRWIGQTLGSGHCVAFLQAAGKLGPTTHWRRGIRVRGNNVPSGAAIATFGADGKYHNRTDGSSHAAVLNAETSQGLFVYDQWRGQPVHSRLIEFRGGRGRASNDGCRFFTIVV